MIWINWSLTKNQEKTDQIDKSDISVYIIRTIFIPFEDIRKLDIFRRFFCFFFGGGGGKGIEMVFDVN